LAQEEFVVVGVQPGDGGPPFALLAREGGELAREGGDGLEYAGSAFVTLSDDQRDLFWKDMDRLRVPRPALAMSKRPKTTWVKPSVRCEQSSSAAATRFGTLA
jgi:ATP-dependent DNA ligase